MKNLNKKREEKELEKEEKEKKESVENHVENDNYLNIIIIFSNYIWQKNAGHNL